MKAAVMHEFGDFDVLKYEDIATPEPKSGHVLVKVLAAGVNRLDHYLREGSVTRDIPLPHILGADAVGEVAELGAGVSGLKAGDKVIVVPGFPLKEAEKDIYPAVTAPSFALPGLGIWGGYAQYIEVPARSVVKDETGLAPERLATLPVVLATAVRSVKKVARVEAGDKVLVQAGASGSGSMLIQVAKALGAEVATTVRGAAKAEFVESLGVDLVIDTRKADFVERIKEWTGGKGADVVIDNLGGEVLAKSIDAVKPLGVVVAFGFAAGAEVGFDIRSLFFAQKQLKGSMASDVADLEWGLEQLRAGRIEAVLDRALPLSDAAQAHRLIAANQVKGNIVLLPWAA
ncbi:MAG: zinc-binding dehydrogenase [Alphaproteobacteria bacterium]